MEIKIADSSCSLPPLQLSLLATKHEHSVTGRPRQWHPFSGEGTFPISFFPIIAKVIATLLPRTMSNQKLNEARIGLLCCSILEMEVTFF